MRLSPPMAIVVAVGASFAIVLTAGFRLRPHVELSDNAFGTIAGLAIPALSFLLFMALSGWRIPWRRPAVTLPAIDDPAYQAFRAAYEADNDATVTCSHLQPVERAMRKAGLQLRLMGGSLDQPFPTANCWVNFPDLKARLNLPNHITYVEGYSPERYEFDNPYANIGCSKCESFDWGRASIRVLHPADGRKNTPWFPAPPPGSTISV